MLVLGSVTIPYIKVIVYLNYSTLMISTSNPTSLASDGLVIVEEAPGTTVKEPQETMGFNNALGCPRKLVKGVSKWVITPIYAIYK